MNFVNISFFSAQLTKVFSCGCGAYKIAKHVLIKGLKDIKVTNE